MQFPRLTELIKNCITKHQFNKMTEIAKQTILSLNKAMIENDIGPVWDVRSNIETLQVSEDEREVIRHVMVTADAMVEFQHNVLY